MKSIQTLVRSLTNSEYQYALKLLRNKRHRKNFTSKYFIYLRKANSSEEKLDRISEAFSRLEPDKQRWIYKKILFNVADAIGSYHLHDNTLKEKKHLNAFIITRKFMLASSVLYNRLAPRDARLIFDLEAEKHASKYDFIPELVEIKTRLSKNKGFESGISGYETLISDRNRWRDRYQLSEYIIESYNRLILDPKFNNPYNQDCSKRFLESTISRIEETLHNDGYLSPKDEFVYLYLKTEHAILNQKFNAAIKHTKRQLNLFHKYPTVSIPSKLAALYGNLSQINALAHNFEGAEKFILSAIQKCPIESSSIFLYYDCANIIAWERLDLNNAHKYSALCLSAPPSHGSFRISKYRYNAACLEFKKGNYKIALSKFSEVYDFKTDKMGYAIWVRIMQILCLIELGEFITASSKVAVLERQYLRLKKKDHFPVRTALVIKFILSLDKADFQKDKLRASSLKTLQLLKEKGKTHSWAPFTPELIKFHEWAGGRK